MMDGGFYHFHDVSSIFEDFLPNPEDYEDKSEKLKNYDEAVDLKEVTTDEESFRVWEGVDEDWEEFNKKNKK